MYELSKNIKKMEEQRKSKEENDMRVTAARERVIARNREKELRRSKEKVGFSGLETSCGKRMECAGQALFICLTTFPPKTKFTTYPCSHNK